MPDDPNSVKNGTGTVVFTDGWIKFVCLLRVSENEIIMPQRITHFKWSHQMPIFVMDAGLI